MTEDAIILVTLGAAAMAPTQDITMTSHHGHIILNIKPD
jgi:hypothetical protein